MRSYSGEPAAAHGNVPPPVPLPLPGAGKRPLPHVLLHHSAAPTFRCPLAGAEPAARNNQSHLLGRCIQCLKVIGVRVVMAAVTRLAEGRACGVRCHEGRQLFLATKALTAGSQFSRCAIADAQRSSAAPQRAGQFLQPIAAAPGLLSTERRPAAHRGT